MFITILTIVLIIVINIITLLQYYYYRYYYHSHYIIFSIITKLFYPFNSHLVSYSLSFHLTSVIIESVVLLYHLLFCR